MSTPVNNHNTHYNTDEIEPIDVMEQVNKNINGKVSPTEQLNIIQALKYILRAGTKDSAMDEINKAENYLVRARTGEWR